MRNHFEYYILDGAISGMANYVSQQQTNAHNENMAWEERQWQEAMTREQNAYNSIEAQKVRDWVDKNNQLLFSREDTANRRAVVDAVKAGLSPLAVAGSGAQASMLSSGAQASASSVPTPASYRAQSTVWNMDMSSLIGAVMDSNKLQFEKDKYKTDHALAVLELQQKKEIADKQLLQQGTQFSQMYSQSEDHYLKDYAQRAEQFSAQTTQQANFHYDDLKEKEKQRAFDEIQASNKMYADLARDMANSAGVPVVFYPVTSVDDYNKGIDGLSNYLVKGNGTVLNKWKDNIFQSSVSTSASGSVDAGVNGSVPFVGSVGVKAGVSGAGSHSENRENVAQEAVKGAYLENGVMRVPILVRDYADWEKNYRYLNDNKKNNNKKSDNSPNRTITEFDPSGKDNVYNPSVRSKVWSK